MVQFFLKMDWNRLYSIPLKHNNVCQICCIQYQIYLWIIAITDIHQKHTSSHAFLAYKASRWLPSGRATLFLSARLTQAALCSCTTEFSYGSLGRGHTNDGIQIIVVILKVTTRFFQQRTWIIGKIIMIDLGSHMPNMNYKNDCGSASVELTQ